MSEMAIIAILGAVFSSIMTSYQHKSELNEQENLLSQEQDFQREREDLMFERNSIPNQYQQMIDSGFNPILAANALMGGNGVSAASSGSSPSAPTTNSAIGALSSMIGQGGQNLFDMFKQNAEIENLQASTHKSEVEAGLMPRDFALRRMSTVGQLKVWNASVKKMKAETKCSNEEAKLIENQNLYYGRKSEAEINALQAKVTEAYSAALLNLERINTERTEQGVNVSQIGVNKAQVSELNARARLENEEAGKTYYEAERERIAKEFEQKLGDIPLTADAQKYVQGLVEKGDIDGIKNFYLNIFATAQNQELGEQLGGQHSRIQLPFGLWSKDYPNPALRTYTNAPVWNMFNYPN